MKQSILVLASKLISLSGFGQTEKNVDSLSIDEKKSQNIVLRCGTSITNYDEPLFIVDGIPISKKDLSEIDIDKILSIQILDKTSNATMLCGSNNGIVLITTADGRRGQTVKPKKYAFKVYQIPNENWTTQQEMYNAISTKVPGVQIQQATTNSTPSIRMRGDDTTIVIVDGIRYDASILNTLNPADIESVKVSNFPGAQNYFINE